ncbi:MAG: RNA polymerase sigma factor [Armatimonadota bacterium]
MTASTAEDEVLISRFQQGETEAFDRLMASRMDKVFALAWSVLRDREEAKDAVQEVFIKLYKALPKFKPSDNLNGWLYRVCLNHCIDRKRSEGKRRVLLTDEDWERLQGPDSEDPEKQIYNSEMARFIRQVVDTLPERQRLVFMLRHYNLLTINEIAEALGCTSGAVKAHLSRATANLRNRLADRVGYQAGDVEGNIRHN